MLSFDGTDHSSEVGETERQTQRSDKDSLVRPPATTTC
jgi:hypothetical protein